MVEHRTFNPLVVGSIPTAPTFLPFGVRRSAHLTPSRPLTCRLLRARVGKVLAMDEAKIRETLENEKARLQTLRDGLIEGDELTEDMRGNSGGEISSVDNHPADLGTEVNQREVTLSTIEQIEAELDDVERAMKKLEDGTYGTSELSGEPIDPERLAAVPTARYTLEEQQRVEAEGRSVSVQDAEDTATGSATPI